MTLPTLYLTTDWTSEEKIIFSLHTKSLKPQDLVIGNILHLIRSLCYGNCENFSYTYRSYFHKWFICKFILIVHFYTQTQQKHVHHRHVCAQRRRQIYSLVWSLQSRAGQLVKFTKNLRTLFHAFLLCTPQNKNSTCCRRFTWKTRKLDWIKLWI